jgi:hypothetical protein
MSTLRSTFALAALLAVASLTRADDLLPADRPIPDVVDHYLDEALRDANVTPAPPAADAALLRRLTLDLVGRIPTVGETDAYLAATDPEKRVKLVERLMASPGFVRHQATEFDAMLMAGTRGTVRPYLLEALKDNRGWDQVFRDVLSADESDPKRKGCGEFLKQRVTDLDKLTTEVSSIFFGVNVSCARCHDHPRVPDWKQDHFFGMKSFFSRTFDNGGFLGERDYGQVKFKTKKGEERQARMMFLTGKVIDDPAGGKEPTAEEQKKEKEKLEELKKNKQPPPAPKFSARAQLADLALQPDQRDFFSRALVNRVWARLFGYGLVTPLDQMHSENPPNHPELLAWLARDTAEHGYDLRRLIRGLVLSKGYARSSRWEGERTPIPALFAVARLRPLTPNQLATSLRIGTTDPASFPADLKPEEFEKRVEGLEENARGFASLIEQPGDDFQVGVGEALLFTNGDRVQKEYLADAADRLVGRLKTLKTPKEQVDLAVRTVLSRPPTAEEAKLLEDYLQRRQDRPVEACRQLVWVLITGAEFRFNY